MQSQTQSAFPDEPYLAKN